MAPHSVSHSRRESIEKISDRQEVLFNGWYYDVTDWISRHPGGSVIKYYTERGEDATQAIQQFHFRSADRVSAIMNSFKKRPATRTDDVRDAITLKRHQELSSDFSRLHEELVSEGLFVPSISHLIYRVLETAIIGIVGYKLFCSELLIIKILGAFLLGLCQGKLGWIQHEGGHNSLTGNPKIDKFIQSAAFGIGGGLSAVWWNSQHNRHHAMPQRLTHDVDLETMPFVAFNAKVVRDPRQGKNFFIKYQSFLYLTFDTFLLAFWWRLYVHPRCTIFKKAYSEFIWIGINAMWVAHLGYWYLLVGYFSALYLLGNFGLSHTHLPVATEPTHWVEYCLRHTTDINPSFWCDWWMGYLNYQIEHHLFPAMPQFRNKLVVERVKALARKHDIPYQTLSYAEALHKTIKNLSDVAKDLQKTS